MAIALPAGPATAREGTQILPRRAWAGDDRPPGPLTVEPEVHVLVVHHTVDANEHGPDDVVAMLRRIHAFHTGEKHWPDIAYNFLVDRFGRIWEGRAGSLDGAVAGDATGGNQGSDQKCAFLGDHRVEPPTAEAVSAMAALLALLADRHGIDARAGATATFSSRGSNLHPAGATVTVPTLTGHRALSRTACPGDAGAAVVRDVLPAAVTARRAGPVPTPTTAAAAPTSPPTTTPAPPTSPAPRAADGAASGPAPIAEGDGADPAQQVHWPAGAAALAALGAGALALRARRS